MLSVLCIIRFYMILYFAKYTLMQYEEEAAASFCLF